MANLGVEFDGLAEDGDGLVQIGLVAQGDAEVVVGRGILGVEFDGLAEAAAASSTIPFVPQDDAEVVAGERLLGSSSMTLRKQAAVPSRRPGPQDVAECDAGVNEFGVEFDGLLEPGDGVGQVALVLQYEAEVDVGWGVVRA